MSVKWLKNVILIGFLIPIINVMAVSILIWYGKKRDAPKKQLLTTLKAIGTNNALHAANRGENMLVLFD